MNATRVPAEINCAKKANGNIDPITTPMIVSMTSARLGKCLDSIDLTKKE